MRASTSNNKGLSNAGGIGSGFLLDLPLVLANVGSELPHEINLLADAPHPTTPTETPDPIPENEIRVRQIHNEIERLRDEILDGSGTPDFPIATLRPLRWVERFGAKSLQRLQNIRNGDDADLHGIRSPDETLEEFHIRFALKTESVLTGIKSRLISLSRGEGEISEICQLLCMCFKMNIEGSAGAALGGGCEEIPNDCDEAFLLLAEHVDKFLPDETDSVRKMVEECFKKFATFRKGLKYHWLDQMRRMEVVVDRYDQDDGGADARPGVDALSPTATTILMEYRRSKLMENLASLALRDISFYVSLSAEDRTAEYLEEMTYSCSDFCSGIGHEALKEASDDTLLAESEIIAEYGSVLVEASSNDVNLEAYAELFNDYLSGDDGDDIRRREIEVYGCVFSSALRKGLEICLKIQKMNNHHLSYLHALYLDEKMRGFFSTHGSHLTGLMPMQVPPEEIRQSFIRLMKKVLACYRLSERNELQGREEGAGDGSGSAPGVGSSLWILRRCVEPRGDERRRPAYSFGSTDVLNDLLDSDDRSLRSSVKNDRYLSHLISEFQFWSSRCLEEGCCVNDIRLPDERDKKKNIAELHSDYLERKWGGGAEDEVRGGGEGNDVTGDVQGGGDLPLTDLPVEESPWEHPSDDYGCLLQDLVTDMATISPDLLEEARGIENSLQLVTSPRSEMLWYTKTAKTMIRAGGKILKDWLRYDQDTDVRKIFEEVTLRILADQRTTKHLKLAQISRLWRVVEMSGLLNEFPENDEWNQAWEEMEVVEYALFRKPSRFNATAVKESFRILQRLITED